MKFGRQLQTSLIRDYCDFYISYDELKAALKKPFKPQQANSNGVPEREPWTEDDEKEFVALLEGNLDKVYTFQKVKSSEITKRILTTEKEVNEVISKLDNSSVRRRTTGADSNAKLPTEEDFMLLEEDLSDIIADVHDLAKFVQLNYTGFQKIIKKHDKQTIWTLKPLFAARLNAKPFFRDNYDATIVKLSRLYEDVKTRGRPVKGDSAAGGSQQNFVRQTTKYWVHPDNITELKLIILKHLPVLVFSANKEFEKKDSAISSIYYDNTDTWELYKGRLKKTEGAEAIRLRWYGGMDNTTIYVERKTHREDWTGEKSVKARFPIKEKLLNDFMTGKVTPEKVFEKARRERKKSEEELGDMEQLAREIQYRVLTRKLVPVTRSFYNRTAFQLPGDARVRISLDTELTMVREDNLDGRKRAGSNWRRMDIGIDYPFKQLPPGDVERFPYAVLEVKLQTQAGQEPPEWVLDLTSSHLVEAVPKFSKFIHGTATLFPTRIRLIPYWMPQMDVDIRKPATRHFGIERHPLGSTTTTTGSLEDDESDEDDLEDILPNHHDDATTEDHLPSAVEPPQHLEAVHDQVGQQEQGHTSPQEQSTTTFLAPENSLDIEERVGEDAPLLSHFANTADYQLHDSDDEEEASESPTGRFSHYTMAITQHIHSAAAAIRHHSQYLTYLIPRPRPTSMPPRVTNVTTINRIAGGGPVTTHRICAPVGKKIFVPVRVEPKVYFACERTFLSWLEFAIIISTIAVTLLDFGDDIGVMGGIAFTVMACIALLWSLGTYVWRIERIKARRAVTYHDKYGPTTLCLGLIIAIAINFGLVGKREGW